MEYIINLYDVKVKNDSIPILLEKFALPTSFALFTTIDSLTASQYNVFGLSVSSEGKASTMRFTKKQLQNVNFCLQNALVFLEGIKSKNLELLKKSGKEDLFDSNWSKTTANLDSIDATYGVIQEASISEMSLYKNEDSKERLEVQCNLKRSKTETANIINLLIDTQTFRVVGFDL